MVAAKFFEERRNAKFGEYQRKRILLALFARAVNASKQEYLPANRNYLVHCLLDGSLRAFLPEVGSLSFNEAIESNGHFPIDRWEYFFQQIGEREFMRNRVANTIGFLCTPNVYRAPEGVRTVCEAYSLVDDNTPGIVKIQGKPLMKFLPSNLEYFRKVVEYLNDEENRQIDIIGTEMGSLIEREVRSLTTRLAL